MRNAGDNYLLFKLSSFKSALQNSVTILHTNTHKHTTGTQRNRNLGAETYSKKYDYIFSELSFILYLKNDITIY